MDRRRFIQLGLGAGALVAVAGGVYQWARPEPGGAELVWRRVGDAVLDGVLPSDEAQRQTSLDRHMQRLSTALQSLSAPTQAELGDLINILLTAPGRLGLMGLASEWKDASRADIGFGLNSLRTSSLVLKQQAFHALRDLTNAAYFSDDANWPVLAYPGPLEI